ncbi:MAG: hypothetical protein V9E94_21160 [Microthrixaceae bacterium]
MPTIDREQAEDRDSGVTRSDTFESSGEVVDDVEDAVAVRLAGAISAAPDLVEE